MNYIIKDYHYANGDTLGTFKNKKEVMDWIIDGLVSCEGCERDPYVNVLIDLETSHRSILRFS